MRTVLCAAILLLFGCNAASADRRFLFVTGLADPLPGWVEFCEHEPPAECAADPRPPTAIRLTRENMIALAWVNAQVNRAIIPMSDEKQYGREDWWAYPTTGKGDCEDYTLEKRRQLIARGFPAHALHITYVRLLDLSFHVVLMVRTEDGDYILDNLREGLLRWDEIPYSYRIRQSSEDPNIWVRLAPPPPPAPAELASAHFQ